MTKRNEYLDLIIHKPWGFEYLFYINDYVAIWCLHISEGCETSLHCHPNKKTGLIVLSGKGRLRFLNDTVNLSPMSRHLMRPGLFHSTKAIGGKLILLEVETPPVKEDIVRFDDKYGRKDDPIEGKEQTSKRALKYPILEPGGCFVDQYWITIESFPGWHPGEAVMAVVSGGLKSINGDNIVTPGDIGSLMSLKRLSFTFRSIPNTEIMTICLPPDNLVPKI